METARRETGFGKVVVSAKPQDSRRSSSQLSLRSWAKSLGRERAVTEAAARPPPPKNHDASSVKVLRRPSEGTSVLAATNFIAIRVLPTVLARL